MKPPRKAFLLRLDGALLAKLQRWANHDYRSLNGQIEHLLHLAVQARPTPREKGRNHD